MRRKEALHAEDHRKLSGKAADKKNFGFFVSLSIYKSLKRLKRAAKNAEKKILCAERDDTNTTASNTNAINFFIVASKNKYLLNNTINVK